MLPGPGPGSVLCMIRERHVILKAALHSGLYSCSAAASYIIMLYCLVYRYNFLCLFGEPIGIFNPNFPIFLPNSAECLHFSAFHYYINFTHLQNYI